ncbi:TPA: AAA family ATPase [Vibrio cholerae]
MNNRVVFTGGPGSGKTSVIKFLEQLGYPSATEVGRKVIQIQTERDGEALPWKDKVAFRDAMVLEELHNYKVHDNSVLTFFDRSIIDSYGYSQLEQIAISEILLRNCRELTYHRKVFIFPPWEAIYENDIERKQDFNEAVATYHEMVKAYERFGYELIEVPKVSVEERAEFILDTVGNG